MGKSSAVSGLFEDINGGLFLRKTPLESVLPVHTISETAIESGCLSVLESGPSHLIVIEMT